MSKLGVAAMAAGLGTCIAAMPAHAEINATVGGQFAYDDNLFRTSKDRAGAGLQPVSDQIYSIQGLVSADVHPADLDGTLRLNVANDWYQHNTNLNNFNYQALIGLQRQTQGAINFSVNGQSLRSLTSFSDLSSFSNALTRTRNIQELNRITGEVTLPITPEFRLVADPGFTQSTSSTSTLKTNDYRQYGLGLGVGWFTPLGNSVAITATRQYSRGLHSRFLTLPGFGTFDSRIKLTDTSIDLKVNYNLSTITTVSGTISYLMRDDRSILNNDYNGPEGNITITYSPRPSWTLTANGGRRLDGQSRLFVDSLRTDYVDVNAKLRIVDRFDLGLTADYSHRRYQYDPIANLANARRIENVVTLRGDVDTTVLNRFILDAQVTHQFRHSSLLFGDYTDTRIQFSVSISLGSSANLGSIQ